MDKGPYSPHVGLDAALGQLGCQLAQGKGTGANALAQPFGVSAGQGSLLVAADLAWSDASSLLPQLLPLADAERLDPQHLRDQSDRLASVRTRQGTSTNIFQRRSVIHAGLRPQQ